MSVNSCQIAFQNSNKLYIHQIATVLCVGVRVHFDTWINQTQADENYWTVSYLYYKFPNLLWTGFYCWLQKAIKKVYIEMVRAIFLIFWISVYTILSFTAHHNMNYIYFCILKTFIP